MNAAVDPAPGGGSITVKGGPGALTRALAEAAREAGATIRVDSPVSQILVRDGRVIGVALEDGSEVSARAVVSGADPRRTLLGLVDPAELGIHIGPDVDYLEHAFDASKYGQISPEPYLDVAIPSVVDRSLCPPGRHVMSICVQYAPYRLANGGTWPAAADQLGAIVRRTLERYAPGISSTIEHQQVLTPLDLETAYGLTLGHIHHGEPSLDQLFTMRPVLGWAQYRMPIEGLFLCGAGTHPGGGITGAPGRNAAREIIRALKG
jgi:phytoene dehydrogenase-like protein